MPENRPDNMNMSSNLPSASVRSQMTGSQVTGSQVTDPHMSATQSNADEPSYASILREIGMSTRDLIQSEIALISAEVKVSAKKAGSHAAQVAGFGALVAVSILPFIAFLVIGLGELIGGNYWLSSLIVAVVCAGVGGLLAYRAYKKIVTEDLDFTATKQTLQREADSLRNQVDRVTQAVKGETYGPADQLH